MDQQIQEYGETPEQVLLVGVHDPRANDWETQDSLDELGLLTETAGAVVVRQFICRQRVPHAGLFIRRGKAEEIADMIKTDAIDTVVFDEDLSPAQGRNLERIFEVKVIDRTQVILDIFAERAHTKDGRLQVELARLQYQLPRLRHMWSHLERQRGGIGVRGGPGEQQLEVDRRYLEQQIERVRKELKGVRRHRAELRRGRRRHGWALISLVGYTNAGKSTLLNRLTQATVQTEDKLFVTLDPTTRQLRLPNHQPALMTDTVGFIKKLPHHLVEAFKATLEEVVEADVLVHVVDASHPRAHDQIEAVNAVLRDLGVKGKTIIGVMNKADSFTNPNQWKKLADEFERCVVLSARTGVGVDDFADEVADVLKERYLPVQLEIPLSEARAIARVRGVANILEEKYDYQSMKLKARIPAHLLGEYEQYLVEDSKDGYSGEVE